MSQHSISQADISILRQLAQQKQLAAADPVNAERAALWAKLNQLQSQRPMLWINEEPWHEMNINDELTLHCQDQWAREQELMLRRELYRWRHYPGDMIINNYISCPLIIHDTGFGIGEDVDIIRTDSQSDIVSREFHQQIKEKEDLEKIKMPVITYDQPASAALLEKMQAVYGDTIPIQQHGIQHIWYTPWDDLIRWWGVEEAMMDMMLRPDLVHEAVSRTAASCMSRLDQLEKLNLLTLNNCNCRIGSGGYGHTDELPGSDFDNQHPLPHNMWGCSNAQIFSEISPEMHWEFALKHDIPWLERWGLTYYGCCEPLDGKLDILKRIKNLRKISMSPWIKLDRAVEAVSDRYVFSYKPNPAVFAQGAWNPNVAEKELRQVLEKTRHCHLEIIMKDISTVNHDPQQLWQWEKLCISLIDEYYG